MRMKKTTTKERIEQIPVDSYSEARLINFLKRACKPDVIVNTHINTRLLEGLSGTDLSKVDEENIDIELTKDSTKILLETHFWRSNEISDGMTYKEVFEYKLENVEDPKFREHCLFMINFDYYLYFLIFPERQPKHPADNEIIKKFLSCWVDQNNRSNLPKFRSLLKEEVIERLEKLEPECFLDIFRCHVVPCLKFKRSKHDKDYILIIQN